MPSGVFSLKQVNRALADGAWSNQKPVNVDYLVVAGGGGGGAYGGGGAGGLLQGTIPVLSGSALTVTVGGGGSGSNQGVTGSNSVFGAITAFGGGGGGATTFPGTAGGSGGGAGVSSTNAVFPGQGVFNQGNSGGYATANNTTYYPAGGGGGAGTVGLDGSVSGPSAGNGGVGVASDISGTRTTYAGGGGGGAWQSGGGSIGGTGGAGGGGTGGSVTTITTAGTANTGGGGGGLGSGGLAGANGGSGIVIISYPDIYQAAASTTGSPTVSTSGSGSLLFDGSNSYVKIDTTSSLFNFGTGDFTLEGWFYFTSNPQSTSPSIVSSQSGGFLGWRPNSTGMEIFTPGIGNVVASDAFSIPTNTWVHLAVTRASSLNYFYKDGVQQGAAKSNANNYAAPTADVIIGRTGTGGPVIPGYMSNLRIVKGTAVYTGSSFAVSTKPLSAVSGTTLLYNTMSGSFLVDTSGNNFVATNPGIVYWNQLSPFATGLGYKNRVYTWTSSGSITF